MDAIRRGFNEYFKDYGVSMPDDCLTNPHGGIRQNGWTIAYRWGTDGEARYLDLYASHRMTNDRLYRVHADGDVEEVATIQEDPENDRAFEEEKRRRGF